MVRKKPYTTKRAIQKKAKEALDDLLESGDEKIRIRAVTVAYGKVIPKEEESRVNIASPYEKWCKKSKGNEELSEGAFKAFWFQMTKYSPHESQKPIHASKKRFVVCICGRRFGKSLLAAKEAEAVLMRPGKRVWVVAPTYALTDKVFREIYKTLVIDRKIDPKAIVKKSESERAIKLAWGSELLGKSADNPDSLIGDSVDYLIIDECAKMRKRVWEKYLRPTLTDREGRALFITTPEGTNWVYHLYKRGLKQKSRLWGSFLFPSARNPHISASDIIEAKKTLAAEVYNQEYMADFFSFSGRIYKDFLYQTHVKSLTVKGI